MSDSIRSQCVLYRRNATFSVQRVLWLVVGLMWSFSVFAANAPTQVNQAELTAYKELQQSKLEALKEAQQKESEIWKAKAEALDKRIDDQLSQVSRSIDQFTASVGWLGWLVTFLLTFAGVFTYRRAKSDAENAAREQASSSAKKWFEDKSSELEALMEDLQNRAKGRIDDLKDYATQEARAVFAIQQKLGYTPDFVLSEIKRIRKDASHVATQPDTEDEADAVIDALCSKARRAFEAKRYEDAHTYWTEALSKNNSTQTYQTVEIWMGQSISARASHIHDHTFYIGSNIYQYPEECRAMLQHESADTTTQNGKLSEAVSTYDSIQYYISSDPDIFSAKVFLSSTVSAAVLRVLIAKRMALRDDFFLYRYQDVLAALDKHGQLASIHANGVVLAIRAYAHHLLGHEAEAESDLSKAFHASENGGADVRDCLGQLLNLYTNPKDQTLRELLERHWRDFQASNRS
jgi:hypothetical protein